MAHGPTPSQRIRETKRYWRELRAFGLQVRAVREARGWTQEATAERSELDVTHLNKIERGVVNITFGTLVRIAQGFGLSVADLFNVKARQ